MTAQLQSRCLYRRLPNGVHEFTLTECSIPALDELFAMVDSVLGDTPSPANIRALVDSSVGVQPMGYCFTRIRRLAALYADRERPQMAFILRDTPFMRMFDIFMRQFSVVRCFSPCQRDEALRWFDETRSR